jgi:hypothetical protein
MEHNMSNDRAQAATSEYITERVLAAMSGAPAPRIRQILTELVKHTHDFVRTVGLTPAELLQAAEFLRACGEISDGARHEFILLSDVLGITMVTDTLAAELPGGAFETSVLGPFYRSGAPLEPLGANISRGTDDGEQVLVHGRVTDLSGHPVAQAQLDVWVRTSTGATRTSIPNSPTSTSGVDFSPAPTVSSSSGR